MFPSWETLPHERLSPQPRTVGQRLRVLDRLCRPRGLRRAAAGRGHPDPRGAAAHGPRPRRPRAARRARPGHCSPTEAEWRRLRETFDELVEALAEPRLRPHARRSRRGGVRRAGRDRGRLPDGSRPRGAHRVLGRRRRDDAHRSASATSGPTGASTTSASTPHASWSSPPTCASGPADAPTGQPSIAEHLDKLAEGQVFEGAESLVTYLHPTAGAAARLPRRARRAGDPRPDAGGPACRRSCTRRPRSSGQVAWLQEGHGDEVGLAFADVEDAPPARRRRRLGALAVQRHAPAGPAVGLAARRRRALGARISALLREGRRVVLTAGAAGSGPTPGRRAARPDRPGRGPRGGPARPAAGRARRDRRLAPAGGRGPRRARSRPCSASSTSSARAVGDAPRAAWARRTAAADAVLDLEAGDAVVHRTHGVGRFVGMVTREICTPSGDVAKRDYVELEYAKGDRLFVPSDQVDAVAKYQGGESPTVDAAGRRTVGAGQEPRPQERPRHRRRADPPLRGPDARPGPPLRPRRGDAARARGRLRPRRDRRPADRRRRDQAGHGGPAADGPAAGRRRRVRQDRGRRARRRQGRLRGQAGRGAGAHHDPRPAARRDLPRTLRRFPRRVARPCRGSSTAAERRATLDGLAAGTVDIVIGTHALLSKSCEWKDLGLVVVDEEQRFGVQHKERLKQLRTSVDVLSMSATPIPRTLEMAVTGIRDLSTIETAPEDRQPVLTLVQEYDEDQVALAIRRELLRDGQVFFVHNQVETHRRRGRAPRRAGARRPCRPCPRADGRAHARERDDRVLGPRDRCAGLHHDRRVAAWTSPTPTR